MKFASVVAKQIIDVLYENNVRLTDINLIINTVNDTLSNKNDEAIVKSFWKESLENISEIFWANEKIASLSVRNIRIKDIFNI